MIDLEYFTLSGPYVKGEGDTLTFLYNTWPERQSRVVFTRDDLATAVRAVGKGNKRSEEILWPREIALAHMTPSGDTVLWDVNEVFMPMTGLEFFSKRNGCNTADHAGARLTQHCCHGLTCDPWDNENVWNC